MYDTPRLLKILLEIGFDAMKRSPFDSDIDNISEIELEGRARKDLIVEGR